jgi:HAD superfamily hydrolase (TIGR01459 family)
MNGLRDLAPRYDGYIIDIWGVLHDGVKPYPGVIDCLDRLRALGKRVVLLSNAPRRAAEIARTLGRMGIGSELYDGIMSSGEAVHLALRDRTDPDFADLGDRLYHLGPPRDRGIFHDLPLTEVEAPHLATFLLNTGPDDMRGWDDPEPYLPTLDASLAVALPMVCANPDLEVVLDGRRIICAGLLAQYYAGKGGRVVYRGKPDPAIYGPTLALLGTPKSRTLAIGDSLSTDMAGAKAAEIDACWMLSGLHPLRLEVAPHEAARAGVAPVAILPSLNW